MPMTPEELSRAITETRDAALRELESVMNVQQIEAWRVKYMGRGSGISRLLRQVASLPEAARREVGSLGNEARMLLEERLAERDKQVRSGALLALDKAERVDVTMPGRPVVLGRYHPITRILREICQSFVGMGFQVVEGPEVEWDKYNFEALNIPKGHAARDMWSTLWIDYQDEKGEQTMLLRTHTSPMQARVMEKTQPPVRVVVPGRCYRYEATDATHEWHFFQVEGLAVDEGITFAHLKGTLYEFARRLFGVDRRVRFRCDYFPFVEPGCEMAIDCFECHGKGCRVCKNTGWIEILGAGMVHPKVLEGVGYDSSRYTGFAFGLGAERVAMLKYGIEDIRLFYSNDLRFLSQF